MDSLSFGTIVIVIVVLYLISSIKILAEYERGVIFRLGRLLPHAKGPGVVLVFAPFDRMVRVSLRVDTIEVPPQDVITRDNVTVKVNAVIYFRVIEPRLAVVEVTNFLYATSQLAQTTLRSVLGEVELDELLSQREKLNLRLQSILDQQTSPWGVKVTMVEVKQVDLAEQMIRAIARQAEAERERRAKIIHAEGEYTAAEKLSMAAEVPNTSQPRFSYDTFRHWLRSGRRRIRRSYSRCLWTLSRRCRGSWNWQEANTNRGNRPHRQR